MAYLNDPLKNSDLTTVGEFERIALDLSLPETPALAWSVFVPSTGGPTQSMAIETGSQAAPKTGVSAQDIFNGGDGNDSLVGGTGDDVLSAGYGDDTLAGGAGNDWIDGSYGNDTYIFELGDGADTIAEDDYYYSANSDTLKLGKGLLASDTWVNRVGDSLELTWTGNSTDKVVMHNYFLENWYGAHVVENIEFSNGEQWSVADVASRLVQNGTSGDDAFYGYTYYNNRINGLEGNDILFGGLANDTLDGGAGDDYLHGNEGGNDVLLGGAGNDTLVSSSGNDSLVGGEGDDVLTSTWGNDTFVGGTGNDYLSGSLDNDTYIFELGDGADTIAEDYYSSENSDTLKLGKGLLASDTWVNRVGDSLELTWTGNSTDKVVMHNYFVENWHGAHVVENIEFSNGEQWSVADVASRLVQNGTSGDDAFYGYTYYNNRINGLEGNDILFGGLANDTLDGGAGDDYLHGNEGGNDVLLGGAGNDTLVSSSGNDSLVGGEGDDVLTSTWGNDTFVGGTGNDYLSGSLDNDTYIFELGDGADTIAEDYYSSENSDTLKLGKGLLASDTWVNRVGDSLELTWTGNSTDKVVMHNYFVENWHGAHVVENIEFSNGEQWSVADVASRLVQNGTSGDDAFYGYYYYNNRINGLEGNDILFGGLANDTLDGGAGDDYLHGNEGGNDVLIGGSGNDTYIVETTSNTLIENLNEGVDEVQSWVTFSLADNLENLTLVGSYSINATGNNLDNVLKGNSASNVLNSGAGDDVLDSRGNWTYSVDTLIGGSGNDTYWVDNSSAVLIENLDEGTDSVQSSVTFALGANLENLTLTGTDAIHATGNDLNNVLIGNAGNNILDGGAGVDTLIGGAGDDTYILDSTTDTVTENSNEGVDWVQSSVSYKLGDHLENLTLTGSAAINATGNSVSNVLTGNAANNTLSGGAGHDTLDGGGGTDTLIGGLGNDTYLVDSTTDTLTENLNEGTDSVRASVSYTLGANLENLTLTGAAAINATGNALNNVLTGNAANNVLQGGAGTDTLVGGAGDDTYVVDSTTDTLTEKTNEGVDLVQSSVSFTLGDNFENLTLTGTAAINATGNALNNVLTGNAGNNTLNAGAGNDTLDGGTGTDTLVGGAGDDTYIVDSSTDTLTEALNAGTDWVRSSVSYTLGANLENLTLTGSAAVNATGNGLNNVLTGNGANNTLSGGAGDDILDGGAGSDTLVGGAGNDTYLVDSTTDTLTESLNEGTDSVRASVSYTLGANLENLTLTGAAAINATGNALNNVLTGNAANNVLQGGAGTDTLVGGAGDDTYVVDSTTDTLTEKTNEGVDLVQSSVSFTLGDNFENLTLTGTAAINATGNALNKVLTGNAGNNTLNAGAGNDTLDGGTGTDTLVGGAGDDTYIVDSSTDTLTENLNEGIDLVQSIVSYALGGNLENLTLTGSAAVNATGNALNNVLTGNAGNNVLNGLDGSDTLIGDLGDDTYIVDGITDTLIEYLDEGTDLVQSSVSYTLGANLENLTLTGAAAINATGNSLNNVLTGNAANNVLNGGAGLDTLIGGAGDDIYIVDTATETLTENLNEGTDLVQSSVSFTLGANLENLTLTGSAAINATGNALNNVLTGNAANNILNGGAGLDTLIGGAGNDTYVVDSNTDTLTENLNEGTDLVQSSVSFTLGANLENLTLTGSAAINATGNALNNMLTGNAANNILNGGAGLDTLIGGAGNDTYVVDSTTDTLTENLNEGTDLVQSIVSFALGANFENLTLTGTAAINATGNSLSNVLTGNGANNVLKGGAGNDSLTGGLGADSFGFNSTLGSTNVDTITDFSKTQGDKILLDDAIFTKLLGKTSLTNNFRLSTKAAVGGDDYIVYNATTGQLLYDATGAGSNTAVVFATLTNKPQDLTGAQFAVF